MKTSVTVSSHGLKGRVVFAGCGMEAATYIVSAASIYQPSGALVVLFRWSGSG